MYPASNDGLNKETNDAVYFFTTAFHPLDNFSAHVVSIWDKEFPTAEHASTGWLSQISFVEGAVIINH